MAATKVVGVRLTPETIDVYADVAELLGVSSHRLMREMLENGVPVLRDMALTLDRVKGGDAIGIVEAFRRLAENQVAAGAAVVAEVRELENEHRADRRRGSPAVSGSSN